MINWPSFAFGFTVGFAIINLLSGLIVGKLMKQALRTLRLVLETNSATIEMLKEAVDKLDEQP